MWRRPSWRAGRLRGMTQPPELDETTKARIRAEELERAKVREEIATETRIRERPSYWTGAILNVLIVGTGFMYIGRIGLGLAWLLVTLALAFLLSPLIGIACIVASYFHYDTTYGHLYATAEEKAADHRQGNLTKWLMLIILLLLLGFWILGRAFG